MTLKEAAVLYTLTCTVCHRGWESLDRNELCACGEKSRVRGITELYEIQDDE